MTPNIATNRAISRRGLGLGRLLRFVFFASIKVICRLLYRFKVTPIAPWPKDAWQDARLVVLLNHTSLLEAVFFGALPFSYLWLLAGHGAFPAADVTMARPVVGRLLGSLAPKVVTISRKRDESWQQFLTSLAPDDALIFMPEGRMKRANGLDKDGKPMTVRGGIVEVLLARPHGRMMIAYSGGLHHLQSADGKRLRLFQTITISFEAVRIEDYLAQFIDSSDTLLKQNIVADLQHRRDLHC